MPTSRPRRSEDTSINLTPMIDVVFLLVIFFLVGSRFDQGEQRVNVNVPNAGSAAALSRAPDERIVEVDAGGHITLDGAPIDRSTLVQTLRQQRDSYPALQVAVRGDAASPVQQVAEVMKLVSTAGVETMGFAVRPVRR